MYYSFFTDVNSVTNLTLVGTGPVLTLSNVDTSVSGTYYCAVVLNEVGIGIEAASLYITPKITAHPVGINATVGVSHTLTCMANSFPDPEYRWEKRSTLEDEYSEVPNSEGSSLKFQPVFYSTNGYYRCIAYTNVSGIINETASDPATVTGKLKNNNKLRCFSLFPILVSPSSSVQILPVGSTNARGGDHVVFKCLSSGGPENIYEWIRRVDGDDGDDEKVSNGGRFKVTPSNMTITGVLGRDFATYVCQVTNLAGVGTASASLIGI